MIIIFFLITMILILIFGFNYLPGQVIVVLSVLIIVNILIGIQIFKIKYFKDRHHSKTIRRQEKNKYWE